MKTDDIYIAENNRLKCVYCETTIKKGEYFFRNASSSYKHSHIVNICRDCLIRNAVTIKITPKELNAKRKEIIIENLK